MFTLWLRNLAGRHFEIDGNDDDTNDALDWRFWLFGRYLDWRIS